MPPERPEAAWGEDAALRGVRRILTIRLDNIGDVFMLGPALRALKTALPEAHLTLMCSPAGSQAAALLPWVDEILIWRAVWQEISGAWEQEPGRELELVERLRRGRYDAALIFTSFTQSPYPPAYVCYLAGIPVRMGQSKEFGGALLTHWWKPPEDGGHQVDRNLALVEKAGIPSAGAQMEISLPEGAWEAADSLLRAAGVDPSRPFIALAPGASAATRRYPAARFAEAARLIASWTGATRFGLPIVLLGSPRERELAASFLAMNAPVVSLIGATSLAEMCALLARSSLVLANNSAALHIADALGRPVVILYSGSELLGQWEPRFAPARLLYRPVNCSPCYRFDCPYGLECLDVPPEEVASAALDLLAETGAGEGGATLIHAGRSPATLNREAS